MRILVVTNMYPPHHLGGYELLCRDVVEMWRSRGHDVQVLTTTMHMPGADAPDPGYPVYREFDFYYRNHLIWRPPIRKRISIETKNARSLEGVLDRMRPDVVSLWHMGAMSMGIIAQLVDRNLPCVFVVGDTWPVYGPAVDAWLSPFLKHQLIARIIGRLTGLATELPDTSEAVFCFASEWLRDECLKQWKFKARYTPIVPHGIDRDVFSETQHERPWRWHLACAGRLDERKGFHVAIRALQHLPRETTLDIWGSGDDRYLSVLRGLASDLGVDDRVRFGSLSRQELRTEYASADAVLFPILWDEPFGLVPIEAMGCGTPVVATTTGGLAEIAVDEVNCLTVPRNDGKALARAVKRLAGDSDLRTQLVVGGLATADVFTTERLGRALEEWHLAAAERFRNGRPSPLLSPRAELRARGVIA